MKYVALLSGGKDSCFNLLHCAKNGHELVAAASLGPQQGKEEIDSYLYQTVGQDAIELVAEALGVPLHRRVISGTAIEQRAEYGTRDSADGVMGDETEDLYVLLSDVKSNHPDIEGVSVGAILSNYQRVRVEHVCRRLSLTCLCYLWQRPQDVLLSEMISAGMESILIKVAGIGLSIKHLGKTLREMQSTLVKLNEVYGSHICGEGGEYETLTLDCPLFKSRIILTEVETVIHSDNDFATVGFLRVKKATLKPKSDMLELVVYSPEVLSAPFLQIRETVLESEANGSLPSVFLKDDFHSNQIDPIGSNPLSSRIGDWVLVSNVTMQHPSNSLNNYPSFEEEIQRCFHILRDHLQRHSLDLTQCVNINMFLSSMDLFPVANSVYKSYFGTSPPARACVAVDLPNQSRVKLDCIASDERSPADRQALHVQSLSYWAPANIGPYSQAVMSHERIFISGQIGLIPSSLKMPSPPSLADEIALSMQHTDRVLDAFRSGSHGGNWVGYPQLTLYWLASNTDPQHVMNAHAAYMKHSSQQISPTLYIVVKSLPRDALVEKQVLLHTGRYWLHDNDEGLVAKMCTPNFRHERSTVAECQVSLFEETSPSSCIICGKGDASATEILPSVISFSNSSLRIFYVPGRPLSVGVILQRLYRSTPLPPTTSIPCRSIVTEIGTDWDYAVCILTS